MESIRALKYDSVKQSKLILLLVVFYAVTGAWHYFKNASPANGLTLGILMTLTALSLDILVTVPLVEIPKNEDLRFFQPTACFGRCLLITS